MGEFWEWEHLSGADFRAMDRERTVVCVTCSPLEVHGPHLPVVTDIWEADSMMREIVSRLRGRLPELDFVILPPLYVASDVVPHLGSLHFRSSTILHVLGDLGRSLAKQGFRHIWVSSFHGGPRHFVPIEVACARTNRKYGTSMVSVFSMMLKRLTGGSSDLSDLFGEIDGIRREDLVGDTHGGAVETSMMLHLLGEHVNSCYKDLEPKTVERKLEAEGLAPLQEGERVTLFELLRGFRYKLKFYEEESYTGHPAVASAAVGAQMFAILSELGAEALIDLQKGRLSLAECHSPLWPVRWIFTQRWIGWIFERILGYKSQVW